MFFFFSSTALFETVKSAFHYNYTPHIVGVQSICIRTEMATKHTLQCIMLHARMNSSTNYNQITAILQPGPTRSRAHSKRRPQMAFVIYTCVRTSMYAVAKQNTGDVCNSAGRRHGHATINCSHAVCRPCVCVRHLGVCVWRPAALAS